MLPLLIYLAMEVSNLKALLLWKLHTYQLSTIWLASPADTLRASSRVGEERVTTPYEYLRGSLQYYSLNVWSRGKQLVLKHQDSRENKTN